MNTHTTKPDNYDHDFYQMKSARAAIAREISRMIGEPSEEVMEAKVKADAALSEYRDVVRKAAREAMERL